MPLMHTNNGFLKAAARGDMETLHSYLGSKHLAQYLKVTDRHGDYALHVAVKQGKAAVIDALLAAGADIEGRNNSGYTPLAVAASSGGRIDILRRLIAAGAEVNAEMNSGSTALSLASARSSGVAVDILLEAKADPDLDKPLLNAVRYGRTDIIKKLVEAGAKTDLQDSDGHGLLHLAAQQGAEETAALLLEKGHGIDQRDRQHGYTPLHWAVYYNRMQMVEFLLERGADPHIKNNRGQAALQLARDRNNDAIAYLLEQREKPVRPGYDMPETSESATETWLRMGETKIAQVGIYPALERKLTEIFNFESRERIVISENLRTGVENMAPPQNFDTIEESTLQKAAAAYRSAGGTIDDTQLTKRNLNKTARLP
jgi:ankyrin repeat protein